MFALISLSLTKASYFFGTKFHALSKPHCVLSCLHDFSVVFTLLRRLSSILFTWKILVHLFAFSPWTLAYNNVSVNIYTF